MDMHGETYRATTSPQKKYSQLTESEKGVWHADTYAWRIIHGYATLAEIAGGKYSPTDPEGEWWKRVQLVVRQRVLLAEQERERSERRRDIAKDDLAAEGRELLNKWAVRRGYVDWDAAWDANMRPGMPPGFLQRVSEEVKEMFPSKYAVQREQEYNIHSAEMKRRRRIEPEPTPELKPTRSELAERYNDPAWMEPEHDPKEDAEAEEVIF